jgi:hypothetical protein
LNWLWIPIIGKICQDAAFFQITLGVAFIINYIISINYGMKKFGTFDAD